MNFISFVKRYDRLLILFVAMVLLAKSDSITYFVGPIFYLIELTLGATVSALLMRHLFFRRTLDAYTRDRKQIDGKWESDFLCHWKLLAPATKIWISIIVAMTLFLGCCLIAASIAK